MANISVVQNPPARRRSSRVRVSRFRRKLIVAFGTPLFLFAAFVAAFIWSTHASVFSDIKDIDSKPVAVVFGAGLQRGGKPSLILRGRLDGAIELYRKGKVHKLLMSGDNRTRYYNEPEAMRKYAVKQHVPNADILLDFAGRDTYDTCYRAKNVFGIQSAILVTQAYHAPRAVYLAREMGIDAVGYAVPNLSRFPILQSSYTFREYFADFKAVWDTQITHRKPYVDQAQ